MFQTWFEESISILFQRSFFNIFSFFDWPFRMCLCPFVDRFTSFIEMLLIFTKKRFFECWEADLLSVSILSDLMLLGVGVRKRAVHKELWSLILGTKSMLVLVDLLMVIRHLVKNMKRDGNYIYLCSKQSIGKYINHNLRNVGHCAHFVELLMVISHLVKKHEKRWQLYLSML